MQALELLHSEFDIDLLLDINMPRLDGFGVLEVMKQRNWLQEIPVIITSSEDDESFIQKAYELGVTDYIRRPFNLTVTQRRVSNALTLYARQKHLVHLAEEQVYEHEKTNSAIINILSHIVESRNFESGTHILHVRAITDILLRQLVAATNRCPLSQADISMISTLSALHDIGKISIPPEILNKPGKLTREEFEIMKAHTTAGDELLQDMPVSHDDPLMRTAHEICRWHHERWDGRGYPDGLKGDEIPVSAQVVALADVYDRWMNKVAYTNWDADEAHRQQTLYLNEGDTVNLLDREIHDALVKQVRQTLPAQPDVTMPATLHIAGEDKPYCAHRAHGLATRRRRVFLRARTVQARRRRALTDHAASFGTARKIERKHHDSQQISPSRARRSGGDDAARRLRQQGRPRIFPGEPCQYHDLDVLQR